MSRSRVLSVTLLVFGVFANASYAQATADKAAVSTSQSDTLGRYEGRTYSNTFFGFSLKLPDDGVIVNQEASKVYQQAGTDLLKSDNKQNNKLIEDDMAREFVLVNYASKPLGSPDNTILAIAARKQPSTAATANMVMAATLNMLMASGKYELVKTLKSPTIGGRAAAGIEGLFTVGENKLLSRLYIVMVNGYSVQFALSCRNDEGLKKGEEILAGLKFASKRTN